MHIGRNLGDTTATNYRPKIVADSSKPAAIARNDSGTATRCRQCDGQAHEPAIHKP